MPLIVPGAGGDRPIPPGIKAAMPTRFARADVARPPEANLSRNSGGLAPMALKNLMSMGVG